MDRRHQRRAVVIPAGRTPAGVRRLVHVAYARRAVPYAGRDGARAGRVGRQRLSGREACLVVPGIRRVAGQPRRHGQPGGRRHGDRRRRAGRRVLDVGHRPAGCVECLRRIDPRSTLQTQGAGLLYRRPGLLHGTRTGQTLDGRPLRRADLRDIRFRLQLGAEQYDLRGLGGCFRLRPSLGRRRPGAAHAAGHLRRHPPYRPGERGGRPGHGTGVYRPCAGRRALQFPAVARGRGADRRQCLRLGAGAGRRCRRSAHAGHQARPVQQRGGRRRT